MSFSNLRKQQLAGITNLCRVVTFSGLKRTNLNFKLLLGRNWPEYIITKLNVIKNWYLRKIFIFQSSNFLTPWPHLTSIYLKRGEPKNSKMVSNHSIHHTHQYALYIFSGGELYSKCRLQIGVDSNSVLNVSKSKTRDLLWFQNNDFKVQKFQEAFKFLYFWAFLGFAQIYHKCS